MFELKLPKKNDTDCNINCRKLESIILVHTAHLWLFLVILLVTFFSHSHMYTLQAQPNNILDFQNWSIKLTATN